MENKTLAKIGAIAVIAVVIGMVIYQKYVKGSIEGNSDGIL